MTKVQEDTIKKIRRYFDDVDEYTYKMTINKAIHDSNFEKLINSMTIDRIAGKSALAKHNYTSKYM